MKALRILILLLIFVATVLPASALVATYNTATDVPVTASSYTAAGDTVSFTLNFAPTTGTDLMVVKNTGQNFITGTFSNLAQGQSVTLSFGGINYNFVANYFGGSGNDLVLHWASSRAASWGDNSTGQLGNNGTTDSLVPGDVFGSGLLSGKTVIAMAAGGSHTLGLCSDGTLAAWGDNSSGQLGNGNNTQSNVPVAVTNSGVLSGKTVIAVAAGSAHSLALCSDGTLAAWGSNGGRLGNGGTTNSNVPVAVNTSGVLFGKTVIAVAAGGGHSLALCSDGTLAAWGSNTNGELGNGNTTNSNVPVLVTSSGVLSGKTVIAVTAGFYHSLALCSDGTLAAWGYNSIGQLGNGTWTSSSVATVVTSSGVLSGKTVIAVSAGGSHSLALCSDGTLAAWGYNYHGQLGNGSTAQSNVPVAVTSSGVLNGKAVIAVTAGGIHSLALCADGTLAAWGANFDGQLGNGSTTPSTVPVAVSAASLALGEHFVKVAGGQSAEHSLGLIASGPAPSVKTLAATSVTAASAILNGTVNANSNSSAVSFDYGTSIAYGTTVAGTPTPVTGNNPTAVSAALTGLTPGTTYHYRVNAVNGAGAANGPDLTFTTLSNVATLSNLLLNSAALSPVFSSGTTSYTASVAGTAVTVTPTATHSQATVTVNGSPVASGSASNTITLAPGSNTLTIVVTAQDGATTQTYTVAVTSAPITLNATYNSAADVPATAPGYTATGNTVNFTLNYAPTPGTNLVVVKNTGQSFILGTFGNLTQDQLVTLSYGGINYQFLANYYGGTGNDLVLQWKRIRPVAWGNNSSGQLGNGSTTQSTVPVGVSTQFTLSGATVTALSAGGSHSMALRSNNNLAGWGNNSSGQVGWGSTTPLLSTPQAVANWTALAGRKVIAVATGIAHSIALCTDGTLASWGANNAGQLGNNSTTGSIVPVAVTMSGVLSGKTVIAVAAGDNHNLALCSDGTVAAWGSNSNGQLGNGSTTHSTVPVLVTSSGVLSGKTVIGVAAGSGHSLALCSDGTVLAWGSNNNGQLGNGNTAESTVPVAVSTSGFLNGKTVIAVTAGGNHNLALCSDGAVAVWGFNSNGQLGDGSFANYSTPRGITNSGALSGRTVIALGAGSSHSLAQCSDGTLAAWGLNSSGQLGNGSTTQSIVPVLVSAASLAAGERFVGVASGSSSIHTLGLVAMPPATPIVTTLAATSVTATSVTLNGTVNANGSSSAVSFDYGTTVSYGTNAAGTPTPVTGTSATAVSVALTGLTPGTTYHFRVKGVNSSGTSNGTDLTFTTLSQVEAWRQSWFGTTANTGNAADSADPNNNGIINFLEYALNGSPIGNTTGTGILPQASTNTVSNCLQLTFTRHLDRNDITLTVQANDAPTGTWTDLAQSVNGGAFTVIAAGAAVNETGTGNTRTVTIGDLYQVTDPAHPRRFMRLQVTRP